MRRRVGACWIGVGQRAWWASEQATRDRNHDNGTEWLEGSCGYSDRGAGTGDGDDCGGGGGDGQRRRCTGTRAWSAHYARDMAGRGQREAVAQLHARGRTGGSRANDSGGARSCAGWWAVGAVVGGRHRLCWPLAAASFGHVRSPLVAARLDHWKGGEKDRTQDNETCWRGCERPRLIGGCVPTPPRPAVPCTGRRRWRSHRCASLPLRHNPRPLPARSDALFHSSDRRRSPVGVSTLS